MNAHGMIAGEITSSSLEFWIGLCGYHNRAFGVVLAVGVQLVALNLQLVLPLSGSSFYPNR